MPTTIRNIQSSWKQRANDFSRLSLSSPHSSGTLSYFLHHGHTLYSVQYANSRVESIWHHFQNNVPTFSIVVLFRSSQIISNARLHRQQSPLHPRQAMGGVQPGPAHCPTCNSVLVFGKKFCKDCGSPTASVWLAIQKEQLAKEAAAKQQAQAAAAAAAAAEDATIVKGGAQAKVDAAAAAAIPNGALYPLPTTEAYTYTKGPAAPAVVDLYSSNSSINSHRDLTRAPQAPAAYASPTSSAPTYEDPQSVTQSVFTRLDSASWVLQLVACMFGKPRRHFSILWILSLHNLLPNRICSFSADGDFYAKSLQRRQKRQRRRKILPFYQKSHATVGKHRRLRAQFIRGPDELRRNKYLPYFCGWGSQLSSRHCVFYQDLRMLHCSDT